MIVELRTYQLKPRSLPEVEKRFGEALPARVKLSPLAGFWHTEVGALNQIMHMWPYSDMNERTRIRAEAVKAGIWPPPRHESVQLLRQQSTLAIPASWSPLH